MCKQKILFVAMLFAALTLTGFGCQKAAGPVNEEKTGEKQATKESLASILEKGKVISNFSYSQIATIAGGGTSETKIWRKNQKMKQEIKTEGKTVIMYIDLENGQFYLYDPAANTAVAMASGLSAKEQKKETADEFLNKVDPDTEIIGREILDGQRTVIAQISLDGAEQKIWFSEEYGLPLKIESRMPDGTMVKTEVKNLQIGNVSDSDVTLPPDVKIMQLPNFPGFRAE